VDVFLKHGVYAYFIYSFKYVYLLTLYTMYKIKLLKLKLLKSDNYSSTSSQ